MNKHQLASTIWESANQMRSKIEANEYKDFILGFIFYKYLSERELDLFQKEKLSEDEIKKVDERDVKYAKILAILRRTKQENKKETITCGAIRMDKQSCQVFVNEREVQLQNKQYEILRFLMEHKNIVWSRDALLNHIWGYDYIGVDRVVDNQIKKLRNALGEEGKRIQTVVGRGYKISDA